MPESRADILARLGVFQQVVKEKKLDNVWFIITSNSKASKLRNDDGINPIPLIEQVDIDAESMQAHFKSKRPGLITKPSSALGSSSVAVDGICDP